mgnify:CR=1 FL=1
MRRRKKKIVIRENKREKRKGLPGRVKCRKATTKQEKGQKPISRSFACETMLESSLFLHIHDRCKLSHLTFSRCLKCYSLNDVI